MIFNFSYIQIIPAAVIVLLLAGLLTAIFVKPDEFQKSRANVFVSITASLVVLVMGFSVFVNTLVFEEQKEINNATFTKKAIDSLWLYPNKLLADSTHARPEFRASFYYNNVTLYQSAKGLKSNQSTTSILEEQNIAIVFIQAWEDYLALRRLDKTGDEVWLNNFLQWAQSPYLKQSFNLLKYNMQELLSNLVIYCLSMLASYQCLLRTLYSIII